jgi:hypothetical protein
MARDRRWDFLYDRQKQPVKAYILERFAEALAGELRQWPPPFVEWVSEDLRRRYQQGLEKAPREQALRFALELARLELRREFEAIDQLMGGARRHWQDDQEAAAGHLLVRFVTEKLLSLKEYADQVRITRDDLVGAVDAVEKRLFK